MPMKISFYDQLPEYYSSAFLLPPPSAPRLFNMIIQRKNAVFISNLSLNFLNVTQQFLAVSENTEISATRIGTAQ
jgi:hypothetical protein